MADGRGGARPGSGRPVGSKNRVPSKSWLAQQRFAELVSAQLDDYFDILDGIARSTDEKARDRIAAVKELLDRGMGAARQTVELTSADDAPTPENLNLLAIWTSTPAAPPIVHPLADEASTNVEPPSNQEF